MRSKSLGVTAVFVSLAGLMAHDAAAQSSAPDQIDPEMIGDWELVSIIERGVDVTETAGVIDGSELYVYTFNADGTFSITAGGRWFESGTWAADRDTEPMWFDHTPTEEANNSEYIGEVSKGIYEVGSDVAKICIADDPPDQRPSTFDTNACLLFILRRASSQQP